MTAFAHPVTFKSRDLQNRRTRPKETHAMIRNSRSKMLSAATMCAICCAFFAATNTARAAKPLRALLVLGGCHDYKAQKDILARGIEERAHVEVVVAYDPDPTTRHLNPVYEKPDWADGFDVVIHDECTSDVKDLAMIDRILAPHRKGLPAVVLHCGMHSYRSAGFPTAVTPWFEFTGLQTTRHDEQHPIAIHFLPTGSPITRGFSDWTTIKEELYNNYTGKLLDTATPLARGQQTFTNHFGRKTHFDFVVVWTNLYRGHTKVFATTIGHNNETVSDPRYLDLVTRGLLWSCGKLDSGHLKTAAAK
jgi:type 1 glutamine amidotransferase